MPRKYASETRNVERTKSRLINAVGEIIRTEGYTGLKLRKVEEISGVDRKSVYDYFGSLDNLVESYIRQKDYYSGFDNKMNELLRSVKGDYGTDFIKGVMLEHFDFFSSDVDMQQAILCHLNRSYESIKDVYEEREKIGSIFLDLAEPFFEKSPFDLRARVAILVSGIYFMILNNKSLICNIDLNTYDGQMRIKTEISKMIDDATRQVQEKKED